MKHSHFNPGLLTFGCEACIQRVKNDQRNALAFEVADALDAYIGWPSRPCPQLGHIPYDFELEGLVYKKLEDRGWDELDIDDALEYWAVSRRDAQVDA